METNVLNPIPKKEFERVLDLSSLNLDYDELNDRFSDLTRLAAMIAGTDISLVNLLDSYTQWTVSNHGIEIQQMPRKDSVCQYTIMNDTPLEIKNLKSDQRFKEKDYVNGSYNLSYYYGIPLITPQGYNIGALCVMDTEEKTLTPEKIEMLQIIANEIVQRLNDIKQIAELKKRLEEAAGNRKKLVHDIRGPLGGIVGLAQIIEDHDDIDKVSDILDLAVMIRKGGESLLDLANDILSSDNLLQGPDGEDKPVPKANEFNLESLKQKLMKLYEPQAASKDIDLTIVNESSNAEIPFPKNKIVQVLGNLISNAIKFTPTNGYVMIRQEYLAKEHGDELLFVVKDSGIGISSELIADILQGEAHSSSGTEGEQGYGFGLQLVKHLTETMNGTLNIESEMGDGCKFTIRLPIR